MKNLNVDKLLTVAQAANERGVTRAAIYHLVNQNKIKYVEIAGKKFINRDDLIAFQPDKGGRPNKPVK